MPKLLYLFTILSLAAMKNTSLAQNFQGDQMDLDAILKSKSEFSKNFIRSDHKKIAERYTEDAKLFPSDKEIIEGRETIEDYFILPENVKILDHKITPSEINIVNNTAYVYGLYEGKTKTAEGEIIEWKGNYVNVWKKEGDQWKVYLEIWNRNP